MGWLDELRNSFKNTLDYDMDAVQKGYNHVLNGFSKGVEGLSNVGNNYGSMIHKQAQQNARTAAANPNVTPQYQDSGAGDAIMGAVQELRDKAKQRQLQQAVAASENVQGVNIDDDRPQYTIPNTQMPQMGAHPLVGTSGMQPAPMEVSAPVTTPVVAPLQNTQSRNQNSQFNAMPPMAQDIARLNKIEDINKISTGQELKLPSGGTYTVKKGDNLTKIGNMFGNGEGLSFDEQVDLQGIGGALYRNAKNFFTQPAHRNEAGRTAREEMQYRKERYGLGH